MAWVNNGFGNEWVPDAPAAAASPIPTWDFAKAGGLRLAPGASNFTQGTGIDPGLASYLQQNYGSAMDAAFKQQAETNPNYSLLKSSGAEGYWDQGYSLGDSRTWDQLLMPALQQAGVTNDPRFGEFQNFMTGQSQAIRDTNAANEAALDDARNKRIMTMLAVTGGVMGAGALGAFGSGGALGAEAAGAGLGEAAGSAGWGVTQGAGTGAMDWISALEGLGGLESLGGLNAAELAGLGVTPESLGLASGVSNLTGLEDFFSDFGSNFGSTGEGMFPTGAEDFAGAWAGNVGGGGSSLWDLISQGGSSVSDTLGGLFGGGGANSGLGGLLGGVLGGGGGLSGLLGTGLGLGAIGTGMAYGYNHAGADTQRLEDLYGQYNPQSMMGLYDLNTNLARDNLTSNLARRGVTGSSFANMDMTNFNTARDIGRNQALGSAVQPAAAIANAIAQQQNYSDKIKSDVIGSGMNAIGRLFSGR